MRMISSDIVELISRKYGMLDSALNERSRRMWAATEAVALGHGGIVAVCRATGLGRSTVWEGVRELELPEDAKVLAHTDRARRPGAGRKPMVERDPEVLVALEQLVAESTAGDPMSPLRWTIKSTRTLAKELTRAGHPISHPTVGTLLAEAGYTLQSNSKEREGRAHPDRDAQFRHISGKCMDFIRRDQPVISVDTKKKELVGDFKNGGRTWNKKGEPTRVRTHDFKDPKLGKVVPYGIYDVGANTGWVNVGTDHDTAEFAVESIFRWWKFMGSKQYPDACELLITADNGGSNGSRNRLWKVMLQEFANRTGLKLAVCHFPPGTSKWNKIEHRLFSHISMNWRGRPLVSHEAIVNLIASTRTKTGLRVKAKLDTRAFPKGKKITDKELEVLSHSRSSFHGDWNYFVSPTMN